MSGVSDTIKEAEDEALRYKERASRLRKRVAVLKRRVAELEVRTDKELTEALGRIANKTMSHYTSVSAMATDFKVIAITALAKHKGGK